MKLNPLSSRIFNPISKQTEFIATTRTACNLGGSRVWFVCPLCQNRCAILYAYNRFACRKCHNGRYRGELETVEDRSLRKAIKLRQEFGLTEGGVVAPFPAKPKWMRWHTYFNARKRDAEITGKIFASTYARLNARKVNWQSKPNSPIAPTGHFDSQVSPQQPLADYSTHTLENTRRLSTALKTESTPHYQDTKQ